MIYYLLIALSVLIVGTLLHGVRRPERFYEYPYFMAAVFYPGLSTCLSPALRARNQAAWLMTGLAACLPFISIVFYGRREAAALIAMTVAITLYFSRRYVMPRVFIVAALIGAAFLIPA